MDVCFSWGTRSVVRRRATERWAPLARDWTRASVPRFAGRGVFVRWISPCERGTSRRLGPRDECPVSRLTVAETGALVVRERGSSGCGYTPPFHHVARVPVGPRVRGWPALRPGRFRRTRGGGERPRA